MATIVSLIRGIGMDAGIVSARVGWAAVAAASGLALWQPAAASGGELPWIAVAAAVLPDMALVYGAAPGLAKGQLAPRAVPLYNAVHVPWGPMAALVAAALLGTPVALAVALGWTLHVTLDRAV